jgi:hypothetical protein
MSYIAIQGESMMTKARVRKAAIVPKREKPAATGKKTFKKAFKDSSGKFSEVTVLDANTATFGTDLLNVFRENVAKARKENIKLFGSPDRAPKTD